MWRTVLLVLFSFIDLSSCDQVTDDVRVTGPVVDTQISATTMPTTTTTDTATDKEVLVDTTTSIFNSDGYDVGLTSEETTETTLSTSYFDDASYMNMNYSRCEIRNVTHKSDTNSIEMEWEDCGDNYDVGLMKAVSISPEIPHFRRLNLSSTYNFTKLAECTAYNISVASDSDKYLETIRTLPGEIQDIETFVSNNMTYVNWSLPESQDCRTYVLQINDGEAKQTRDNSVEMNYDFAKCTTIQISAVDTSNTTGNVSTRTVPGAVTDFVPVFNHNSITLNWNPPEDDSCVTGYTVQLDEDTPVQLGDTVTRYTYENLAACTEYTVRVAALSKTDPGQYSSVTNKTDTPSTIEKVEGLTLILSDATTMRASWEPPSSQSACITDYAITMWDQNDDTVNYKTTDTYYDFTPLVPCKEYHVMVMPRIGTNEGASETENMTIDAAATNPPTLRYSTTSKTSCSIHLQMDSYSVNMCNITMVIVNCTAKGNEPHDWIIDERHIEHSHTDSKNSRQVSVVVDELSEYTIYDCYAYDVNTGGESSQSASISFRTNEDVPSAPQNLMYTVDDDSILITWEKPFKIPGTLKNYHIIVEEVGPLYYIPENCSDVEASIDEDTDELEFRFNNFSFHYRYNVSVTASTEAGHGEAASIDMKTPTGASDVPIEVTHEFETSAETSNLSLMVKWARPCHTKGDLKEFQWTLVGQPQEGGGNDHIDNGTVMANENETDTNYILRIPDIQARYSYTFTIAAYTRDGVRGEEFNITGVSPDGFPSAPENLTVGDIQATSANISWAAPLITNGEILSYLLTITTTGPSHYIPEGCVIDYQDAFKYTLNSTQLNYVSWEFMPHFQYTVYISAATTAGYGLNASVSFTTSQAESEAPRNVSYGLDNILGERYNTTLHVEWLFPCNTNGNLTYFMWVLEGNTLDTSNHFRETGFSPPNDPLDDLTYGLKITGLLPMCNYTLTLSAVVDSGYTEGHEYKVKFQAPDGYASPPMNFMIDNVTATTGNITWEEPLEKNGEIQSYQVLIRTYGPIHYIPSDCHFAYVRIVDNVRLSPTTFEYPFIGFPNFKYTAIVLAINKAGRGFASSLNFTTAPGQSTALRNVHYDLDNILGETYDLTLYVDWLLPCNTNGNLTHFAWTLESTTSEGNETDTQAGVVNPNDSIEDSSYRMKITNLMSMTSYVLTLAAYVDGSRIKGEAHRIEFQAPDGYSSAPLDLRVEDVTDTRADIVWDEPTDKNGEIQAYRIFITTDGPQHYIPSECVFEYDEIVNNNTLTPTSLHFPFAGLPNFRYNVAVAAGNGAGYGYESTIQFSTMAAKPPAPIFVSNETHNVTEETNRASITINWKLPCNTNGTLKNFVWNLVGHSLEDSNNIIKTSGNISVNENPSNIDYETTLDELFPYHSYKASIAAAVGDDGEILGDKMEVDFVSHDGYPSAPTDVTLGDVYKDHVYVHWKDPSPKNGVLTGFKAILSSNGPLYDVPEGCVLDSVANTTEDYQYVLHTFKAYTRSNYNYTVGVAASTKTGYGPQTSMTFTTPIVEPDPVQNISATINDTKQEIYEASATLSFDKSCNLHDDFSHYIADIVGQRKDKDDHNLTQRITEFATDHITLPLQPEFTYFVQIETYTKSGRSSATNVTFSFTAPAGVPAASTIGIERPVTDPTNATFRLSSKTFDDSQGEIKYYAIIISAGGDPTAPESGGEYGFWDSSSWPKMGFWSSTAEKYEYQVTPNFWAPFKDTTDLNYTYMIGEGNCSSASNVYCNGPLRPNTRYGLRVRGFTEAAYRDTQVIYFTTPSDRSYLALILGVIFGALAAVLVLLFIFVLWRRRKKEAVDAKEAVVVVQSPKPPAIPKSRFEDHCLMFEDNRNELKAEYSHLDRLSAAEKPSSDVAMADNNKKKNRYINIMAYDDTRVKLTTDNNDNYEDYINASYIRGYSGNYEYIATQGPMESTLEDFWRMILQEEVGLIVMVAQFVEQSKQKCYKYFPEKEETMIVGNEIHVKCTSEADMTDYVTRNLIVEKDDEQMIIKHLQFMLWPDFGCPTTTHSMLEFRDIMRRHIEVTKTKAVIHCSAGVGRTGTLITIDILLQKIDNSNDDIDVFGTVLDLRRQRTHMVQTEKQYEYIHKCLRDYLIKPKQASDGIDNYEPIYENVAIINGYMDTNRRDHENNVSTENLIRLKEL